MDNRSIEIPAESSTRTELGRRLEARLDEISTIECPYARQVQMFLYTLFEVTPLAYSDEDISEDDLTILSAKSEAIYASIETEIASGPTVGDTTPAAEFAAL